MSNSRIQSTSKLMLSLFLLRPKGINHHQQRIISLGQRGGRRITAKLTTCNVYMTTGDQGQDRQDRTGHCRIIKIKERSFPRRRPSLCISRPHSPSLPTDVHQQAAKQQQLSLVVKSVKLHGHHFIMIITR